ncbi:MAG: mandelate racemase/muconate lactonizing enzyme family protein [Phycisphaerales bacterium]|nr:MAG: mandelate racemase/muconate lactonizing enzyme family protein [Phycisphaerales bacterium]
MSVLDRRRFLKAAGAVTVGVTCLCRKTEGRDANKQGAIIKDLKIEEGVTIEADDGTEGSFKGSGSQDLKTLQEHHAKIRELLVGKDPFDPMLEGELLWETIYPGKARLFAQGRDPLTGETIVNKPRKGRHTGTGRVFMAFGTVDIALWDLRGKLLKQPAYRIIGTANRRKVPVYWRPGEANKGLDDARQRAREAYEKGYRYQKWYFTKSAKDGDHGLKGNIELVRVLREELPNAGLMFDNHSIRYYGDVEYSVKLCKAIAPYRPFWVEEPICPEHVDGYTRIKEEAGVTIAGGEHWHTRWQVKPFLERKCVDYVQSDPVWCGGISEWLRVCDLVRRYPGVKVVPHITSPWIAAPHCVASQPEELCPLLEFNYEGGRRVLLSRMSPSRAGEMFFTMPEEPGIS